MDYLTLPGVVAVIALIPALWHGAVFSRDNQFHLGFKWGYFVIYNVVLFYVALLGLMVFGGFAAENWPMALVGSSLLCAALAIGWFALQRRKWALVVCTILSMNVVIMIINIFYLRNRWDELTDEVQASNSAGSLTKSEIHDRERPQTAFSQDKASRLAILLAVSWTLFVPIVVFIFQPYGRFGDSELVHLIGVMLLPPSFGVGLYFAYWKFVLREGSL